MTGRKEKLKRFIKLNVVLPLFAGFLGTFSAILEECSPLCFGASWGPEFTGKVVEAVNKTLGVEHAFGAAYHPQSQGYIEGRHKTINQVLAAYAGDNPGQWARRAKLAQWVMRATPRSDRDGKSPYEIVTGLKPPRTFKCCV